MNSEAWDVQNIKEHQRSTIFQQNRIFLSTPPQRSAQDLQAENSYTLQFQDSIQGWTWVEFVWLPVSRILSSGNIYIYIYVIYVSDFTNFMAGIWLYLPSKSWHPPSLQVTKTVQNLSFFSPGLFFRKKKKNSCRYLHTHKSYQGSASPSRSPSLIPLGVEIWDCHPHWMASNVKPLPKK